MKLRLLAASPFAAAFVVVVIAAVLEDDSQWPIIDSMTRAAKLFALFGCLVAGLSFERDEHMRRGWLLQATTYGLLALRDGILHRDLIIDHVTVEARWIDAALVTAANVAGVLSSWILSRAWRVSHLELPGRAAWRGVARGVAIVMAVAITLPSLVIHTPRVLDGEAAPVVGVVSSLGDAISLALIAPVVLTAMSLRGTRLAWPWMLLAVGMFGWLFYDATHTVSALLGVSGRPLRAFGESARVLAATATGVAGVLQRIIAHADPPTAAKPGSMWHGRTRAARR